MRTLTRLGLYGLVLAVLFTASFTVAGAVVPGEVSGNWATDSGEGHGAGDGHRGGEPDEADDRDAGGGHDDMSSQGTSHQARGLASEQDGYRLHHVSAPTSTGERGTLSFAVTGPNGDPVTEYDTSHEKKMHLIVVRTDGGGFDHVHPQTTGDGTWSIPWEWDEAGSYRLYADLVPTAAGEDVTLSHFAEVAGQVDPSPQRDKSATATVGGYEVSLDGTLVDGEASELAFSVTRNGSPVTNLQPYLGAYGHLVALREGDLAYLHVHPLGEPDDGQTEPGPQIEFTATAPTAGTYLLYLDFQVDGTVHTAEFTITTG